MVVGHENHVVALLSQMMLLWKSYALMSYVSLFVVAGVLRLDDTSHSIFLARHSRFGQQSRLVSGLQLRVCHVHCASSNWRRSLLVPERPYRCLVHRVCVIWHGHHRDYYWCSSNDGLRSKKNSRSVLDSYWHDVHICCVYFFDCLVDSIRNSRIEQLYERLSGIVVFDIWRDVPSACALNATPTKGAEIFTHVRQAMHSSVFVNENDRIHI